MSAPMSAPANTPSLLTYFARYVPEYRSRQGRRYPLSKLLAMITMALMSGHYAYREMARFLKVNQADILDQLRLPRRGVPSHVTIRTTLQRVDEAALCRAFEAWAAAASGPPPSTTEAATTEAATTEAATGGWVAIDGKAIGSTVVDSHSTHQNFSCLVSAYAQAQGVLASEPYCNKTESERVATRRLIDRLTHTLGLREVCFTLDALYCEKKHSGKSLQVETTTLSR